MNTPGSGHNERGPCSDRVDVLSALLDGELSPEDADRLRAHTEICAGCRDYATALERDHALFATRFSTIQARPDFTERVMAHIQRDSKKEVTKMKTLDGIVLEEETRSAGEVGESPPIITGNDLFKKPRRSVSLIEIFVTLGICGALAAILFPTFAKAREKARTASCQSNLKQIGLAFFMFEQDKARLPNSSNWMSDLMPYTKNSQIFIDPSGIGQNRGYAMNPAMSGRRIRDIANPAETALAYDAENGRVSCRHSDGCNVAFADGHVKWISKRDAKKLGLGSTSIDMLPTGGTTQTVENAAALGRHIGYTANLSMEAPKAGEAVSKVESIIDQCGGFLINSNLAPRQDGGIEGSLTARVPKDRFSEAVNAIAGPGRLKRREIIGEDATEQYVAAHEKLVGINEQASRILQSHPGRPAERALHEEKLQNVAQSRRQASREFRGVAAITELATINVNVFEPVVGDSPVPALSRMPELEAVKRFMKQVAHLTYVFVGCVVICAPLWLPVLGGWWLLKRRQRQVVAPA